MENRDISDNEWLLPSKLEEILKFSVRDSDVFLLGYPKSGTTWAQEMIWLLANDLNYEGAKVFIDERFPLLEMSAYRKGAELHNLDCHINSIEFTDGIRGIRYIKSHLFPKYLPKQLLKEDCNSKIIYIARNPKDVAVSSYMYLKYMLKQTNDSFENYCEAFIAASYYWNHVLYFWNCKDKSNILFITYENMKNDLLAVIRKVAKFLNKFYTEQQERELMDWLSFDKMKMNQFVSHNNLYGKAGFIRSGKVGDHKTKMSAELTSKFDQWMKNNLRDTDYVT